MGRTLYFDCFAGISGDMTLGALIDLGVEFEQLMAELHKLDLPGWQLQATNTIRNGIAGTDVKVILHHSHNHAGPSHAHHHRNIEDIRTLIMNSGLSLNVKRMSIDIFEKLAAAEAKIHNRPVEEVHFHEVGAVDSIIDIVGSAICIDLLKVDEVYASPLNLGTGAFVNCAHGLLPVEAPATMELLRGVSVYSSGLEAELVTPTGAAIITTLARDFAPMPALIIDRIGYGAGDRELPIPNLLRVVLAQTPGEGLVMLESNIDDMNPEVYSHLFPLLLEEGALDVYLTPVIMKKNRPGNILSVLCPVSSLDRIQTILFSETTTLGIRKSRVERVCLEREVISVPTRYGAVAFKTAYWHGAVLKYAPEYEDCQHIAIQEGIPLRAVYEIVTEDARRYIPCKGK